MNTRSIIRALVIAAVALGLWAFGGSPAPIAQDLPEFCPPCDSETETCPPCVPFPQECVPCTSNGDCPPPRPCDVRVLKFAGPAVPQPESHVALFENNAMEVTARARQSFDLPVWFVPHTMEEYRAKVRGTAFEDSTCNPTGPPPWVCAVISVDGRTVDRRFFDRRVTYIQSWELPPAPDLAAATEIMRHSDDFLFLKAPGQRFLGDTREPRKFTQNIFDRFCPNYVPVAGVGCEGPLPGEGDQGVRGRTDGFSYYVVAEEKGDDDDFDDDDERDDTDDDDDNDGKRDNDDDDDDNDGTNDLVDLDDDNDRIADVFDGESTKEQQRVLDNDVNGGDENTYDVTTDTSTLLLTATAEAFQLDSLNQWLRVEIYAPNGTLLAVSPPTPGWTVAAVVPVLPGTYSVKVRNLSGGPLTYRTLLITTRNWLPGELR